MPIALNCVMPGNPDDAEKMIGRLRQADIEEIEAGWVGNPNDLMLDSWENSVVKRTIWQGDQVAAIFGVAPLEARPEMGVVWMLGTDLVRTMARFIMENTHENLSYFLSIFPVLINFVDVRNKVSLRWLKWSGFTICAPEPFGEKGNLFHMILKEKHV